MRFGTDNLGIDEVGTDGLVYMRLVKPTSLKTTCIQIIFYNKLVPIRIL